MLVDRLNKIIYYKLIKTTINATEQIYLIIDLVGRKNSLINFIMNNEKVLFMSKF